MDKFDQLLDHYNHAVVEYWRGRCPPTKIDEARDALKAHVKALRPEDGGITQALVEMARANAIEECARVAESEAAACQLGSPADKNCWPAALQACATKIRAIDAATQPQVELPSTIGEIKMRDEYANNANKNVGDKLAEMPKQTGAVMGCAGRASAKGLLLEHAERLRREANQLETLAYAVERIQGDAEATLHRLLSGDFFRR